MLAVIGSFMCGLIMYFVAVRDDNNAGTVTLMMVRLNILCFLFEIIYYVITYQIFMKRVNIRNL